MNNSFKLILAGALMIGAPSAFSQQTDESFNLPLNYLLALPETYAKDTTAKWPMIIFLHGSGERGDSLAKVKVHGPPKLVEQGKKFPFIVVSPQASMESGWNPEILELFLRDLKKKYRVDKERIYLTGLSMGGYGTWAWAMKYPQEFAAIAPICGGGDSSTAKNLKNIPIWCFHGGKDNTVPLAESERMVTAAKKYNSDVRLTIYPEAGHDSWTEAYNNDSLYTWFLQHKKFSFQRVPVEEKKLNEYAGYYSVQKDDTLQLEVKEGKLIAKTEGPGLELIPLGNDRFFFFENDQQVELKFFRNKKKQTERFVLYFDRQIEFRKVK